MMTDMTIGQYYPAKSLLHRMDPRMKLVLTLLFIVVVFLPRNWVGLGAAAVFLAVVIGLSRLPLRLMWRSIKPILLLVLFTSLLNMFYVTGGTPLLDVGFIHITSQGVYSAVFIAARILCLILGSSLLTYTTTPTALTDAIEYLLRPLRVIHVNAHDIAMMMTIALRFIPTLLEETNRIMKAQTARGANFTSGSLIQRGKNMIPLLVPLFVSAFRRADDLATAMEARCYRGGEGRTRMNELSYTYRDGIAMAAVLIVTIVLAVMRWAV